MKLVKFKIIILTSLLLVSTGAAISCGHKKNPPPPPKTTPLIPLNPSLQQRWEKFKLAATKETPTTLKNSLSPDLLKKYSWTSSSKAKFWYDSDAHFTINNTALSITTFIAIDKVPASLDQPLKFNIKYNDQTYNISNWISTDYDEPAFDSWYTFKKAIEQNGTPNAIAQSAMQQKLAPRWKTGDQGEWNIWGRSNPNSNPFYFGMKGTPIFDNINHQVSAIVSIVNQGNYFTAYPLKVTIEQYQDHPYNVAEWNINPMTQFQSRDTFLRVCTAFTKQTTAFWNNNNLKKNLINKYKADPNRPFSIGKITPIIPNNEKRHYKVLVTVKFSDKIRKSYSKTVYNTLNLVSDYGSNGPAYQQKNWILS